MLSMANLQASDSCLQASWGTGQARGSSAAAHGARKNGGSGKSAGKRLLKRAAKNSVDLDDYEEEQDHLDACFKDSDYGECLWAAVLRGAGAPPRSQGQAPVLEMWFIDLIVRPREPRRRHHSHLRMPPGDFSCLDMSCEQLHRTWSSVGDSLVSMLF